MMEIEKIRELQEAELEKKLSDMRIELKDLRFKRAKGELKNLLQIRETRRDIARIMTVINEKGRGK